MRCSGPISTRPRRGHARRERLHRTIARETPVRPQRNALSRHRARLAQCEPGGRGVARSPRRRTSRLGVAEAQRRMTQLARGRANASERILGERIRAIPRRAAVPETDAHARASARAHPRASAAAASPRCSRSVYVTPDRRKIILARQLGGTIEQIQNQRIGCLAHRSVAALAACASKRRNPPERMKDLGSSPTGSQPRSAIFSRAKLKISSRISGRLNS